MMDYKEVLGLIGVLIALTAYSLYFRDIFFRHTKPHAFSWLVWGTLAAIGFAAQVVGGGGAGSWVLFVDAVVCVTIFIIALFKGEKGYTMFDWVALLLAGFSLVLWWLTKTPTLSVLLITAVDACGFLPTYRKSFLKPFEESLSMFVLSMLKFIPVLIALDVVSIDTAFYPSALILMNGLFVGMLLIRRHQTSIN